MGSHPLVVSHNVLRESQPLIVLQCPSKGAAQKKYPERMGCHPLGYNVFTKSGVTM